VIDMSDYLFACHYFFIRIISAYTFTINACLAKISSHSNYANILSSSSL